MTLPILFGAEADGWIPSPPTGLDRLTEAVDRINDAAVAAGRDPSRLRKIYNISGLIGRESDEPLHGSVRQRTDPLTSTVTEQGMNGLPLDPPGRATP